MRRVCSYRMWTPASALLFVSSVAFAMGDVQLPARFTAWAINMGRGGTASVDLTLTRWSTPGELEQLSSAFNERGTEGLVRALERVPRVGSFRANGGLAYDVQFAQRSQDADGSQRIFIVAQRRVGIAELVNMTPSADYPLTVIELHVKASGEGTGTMWPVARIRYWDAKTQFVVVDNYTWQPIQLTAVKLQKDHGASIKTGEVSWYGDRRAMVCSASER
jgi:hypothetical protein